MRCCMEGKMKHKKALLAGLAAALFVAAFAWAVLSVPEAPPADDSARTRRYEGNTLSLEKDGRTVWQLTAESIEAGLDGKEAEARNIEAVFHEDDGRELKLAAPHAHYDMTSKDLVVDGGVQVETSDGIRLTSREVIWSSEKETLAAVGDALLTQEEEKLRVSAERIESSDGFARFTASGKDGRKARIEKGSGVK